MSTCFSTLAMRAAYRARARLLCQSAPAVRWVVVTDDPADFSDLPVRVVRRDPTGPMADDYLDGLLLTGEGRGAAAYHDKRFAIHAALEEADTAIYVDADSRIGALPQLGAFPPGVCVLPVVRRSVAQHLARNGSWRTPAFVELAEALLGYRAALGAARWCHEALIAVTKDGRESAFFEAWSFGADFLQARGVYSGEGGVIGLAALRAGWAVDQEALSVLGAAVEHEGGGPKREPPAAAP